MDTQVDRLGGRKPSGAYGQARTDYIGGRVSPACRQAIDDMLATEGITFGAWIERSMAKRIDAAPPINVVKRKAPKLPIGEFERVKVDDWAIP